MKSLSQSLSLIFFSTLLIAFGLVLQRCSSNTELATEVPGLPHVEDMPVINPAFTSVNVNPTHFQLDAQTGGTHTFPTGTQVTVPADILVDAAGNAIEGEVEFSLREFHDAADLMLSGITMRYDSAGTTYDFQTAGMMEIEAAQNGTPVYIKEGNTISVSLASFTEEDDYNLYYLDETQGEWGYIGQEVLGPNEAKDAALKAVSTVMPEEPELRPMKPKKVDPEEYTFNFAVDYSNYPELASFEEIVWEYSGDNANEDPIQNDWVFETEWNRVELAAKDVSAALYTLNLSNDWGKSFSTTVTPALEGRNYEKAMEKFNADLAEYNANQSARPERSDEEKRLNLQANMLRTFQVSEFGIYNCDRFVARETQQLAASFKFDEGVEIDPQTLTVYLVTGDNRAVIPYGPGNGFYSQGQFKFDPSQQNKLVAVIPGNQVAVCSEKEFKNFNYKKAVKQGEHTFRMRTIDAQIDGPEALREALNII